MTEHENQTQETSIAPNDVVESVRDLIDMMKKGGIGELDLKSGDVKIRLRSETVALAAAAPVFSMPATAMGYPAPQAFTPATSESAPSASVVQVAPANEGHLVTSPMIGTYYSASAPGEPPFVTVGDEVETGQVIGIIEAMKIMNEITADKSGVVVEIMVDNAEAVEYGTPLIRISSSARLD
jgi:acetyl-CoA carboxylase biotin carboxyl carrier protein